MRPNDGLAERLWRAESVVDILGKMDPERLPPEEGRALGECQAKAMDEWLSAYIDLKSQSS
jgi:hypothetical protein